MDEGLSENHRRVVGSGMLIVDAAAVRMLNLLEDRNSPVAVRVVEGSVDERERERIRAQLKQLQSLIACLVEKYDVQPSKKNLRHILAGNYVQLGI